VSTADLRLAQLICSHVCHDLAGAAGAVNAGLELLAEPGGDDPAARDLLATSARQVMRRLTFYRLAFGFGGGETGTVAFREARDLASAYLAGGPAALDWPPSADDAAPRPVALCRLLLCLVLSGAGALPRGGVIQVRIADRDGAFVEARITAQGRGARLEDGVTAGLCGEAPIDALTSRVVHGHYAWLMASGLGGRISVFPDAEDEIQVAAEIPAPIRP